MQRFQHRMVIEILEEIAALETADAIVEALRVAPRPIKALLALCFRDDLTIDPVLQQPIAFERIPTNAYTRDYDSAGDEDLFAREAMGLQKIVVVGANPNLSSAKRLSIFRDILERVSPDEARLLLSIVQFRKLSSPKFDSIDKNLVRDAGLLAPPQPVDAETQRRIYEAAMAKMSW